MTYDHTTKKHLYLGIFWKVISCFCFAGVNAIVRYLSGGSSVPVNTALPTYMIMFFQNAIGTLMILPLILNNKLILNSIFATKHYKLHIIRIITAVLGIGFWYLSLQYIPMAQVVALSFAAPFITIFGAIIFLRETINLCRIIVIFLSIIGCFLIARPDLGLGDPSYIGWLAMLPLIATVIFTIDKLITRKLLLYGESPAELTLLLIAFTAPLCLVPATFYGWQTPDAAHWPWLVLLAILGVGAHFTFSKAFSYAEVTILMPFTITKLLFCGLIGYLAFSEVPKTLDMWGGILIATLSAIILNYDKRNSNVEENSKINA
jgi:drug/metabolite transporter (DMT)-like permease